MGVDTTVNKKFGGLGHYSNQGSACKQIELIGIAQIVEVMFECCWSKNQSWLILVSKHLRFSGLVFVFHKWTFTGSLVGRNNLAVVNSFFYDKLCLVMIAMSIVLLELGQS